MTLLITVFAAVITTVIWYRSTEEKGMYTGGLALMYWGASIMWFIDAVVEFRELKADYFVPETADMINDAFLGLSVVALGLIVWVAYLLFKDPKGKVRAALLRKK